ncbi:MULTISPECIES: flagellar hook-length control protein FliK [unclassified Pseudomonas]|uniref:flagellar hook-length control protein FliK n=1 Tax=unclassified Pseudomonas TaxID=196821 RepID=UPI000CD2EB96|nr:MULTISPECIES: flagellar hook-length control protein FliK [unclassified Pseudomonas]POA32619.1 flagellar hook-length control protein FliK [Pseudomonas sp. GW456-R21]POA68250.1 flagellar hook-length control protein FliK [Pseudomonas sp. GW460-R15]
MPLAPNSLLQATSQAKTQSVSASVPVNAPAAPAEPRDKAASFSQVYAKQAQATPASSADGAGKNVRDKVADSTGKKVAPDNKSAAPEAKVADSGKSLPADKPADTSDKAASDTSGASDSAVAKDAPVADSAPLDPTLDPALAQAVQPAQAPVPVPDPQTPPVVAQVQTQPQVDPALAATVTPAPAQPVAATDPSFDPAADPLDAMPAVRLALEQSGHVSASSQSPTKATPDQADSEPTAAQNFANGMASMLDVQASKDSTSQGGEKSFSGLIDDGLKDLKSATSDTRVDDFANRLAALTQAATPKTANALPVNQPIAMHQSGWTEEVVNRVMYLSSANLKAADIQLQPAELGRLDIRVNMVPDQQTQVTFMSAHVGVREALDSQMHRLRDMFAQQGMGQVDVNVSDQSRGWQGQGQQQAQQGQGAGTTASGGRLGSADEELPASVAEAAASTTSVIGSSAVDYYA